MAHLSLFLLCQRHVIAVKYSIQLRDVVVRVHLSSGVVVKKMQALLLSPARKLLFQRESYGRFVVEEQRFLASALTFAASSLEEAPGTIATVEGAVRNVEKRAGGPVAVWHLRLVTSIPSC